MNPFKTLLARLFRCAPQRPYEAPGPDSVGISAVSPSTKLTVDGEFDPNREGPSDTKFTWSASNLGTVGFAKPPAPKFVFNAGGDVNRPVLTIAADGKIILHDDADPTEAAKQCLDAMQRLLQGMLQRREDDTVEAIASWLGDSPQANCDDRSIAYDIRDRAWKQ